MAQAQLALRGSRPIPNRNRTKEKIVKPKTDLNLTDPYSPSSDVPHYDHQGRLVKRYSCDACADCFLFKQSLNQHINRRSVKLACLLSGLGEKLHFYNKCALHYYLKSRPKTTVCKDSELYPLMPDDKSPFIDNLSLNQDKEETRKDSTSPKKSKVVIKIKKKTVDTPSTNGNSHRSPNKPDLAVTKSPDDFINSEVATETKEKKEGKCLECNKTFVNISSRKEHFNLLDASHGPFQCSTCHFWCPNSCSLKAHKRLHLIQAPYVCPECGYLAEKSFKKIITHSIIKCQHLLRHLVYLCSLCKTTYSSTSSLIDHITTNHTKQLIRCSTCNTNFETIDGFERHKINHPSEDGYRSDNFYRCHLCSKELCSKILCYNHIENHLKETNEMYKFVYVCPQCRERQCDSGSQVLVHLQAAHLLDLTIPDREASLIKSLCDRFKLKTSKESAKESTDKGATANGNNSSNHSFIKSSKSSATSNHLLNDPNLSGTKFACEICGLITSSWDDMAHHGITKHIEEESLFVCLICSNKKFTRRNSLLAHLRKFHTTSLACPSQHCISLRFSNANDIYNHYRLKHHLADGPNDSGSKGTDKTDSSSRRNSDVTPAKRPKSVNSSSKKSAPSNNKSTNNHLMAKNDNDCGSINNPLHHPSSMDVNPSSTFMGQNGSSDLLRDSLINGSYLYSCTHCGFQADGIKQLQAHYTVHRTSKTPYLCYECGASFNSYPQLDRHLITSHEITDCQNYVKINLPDLYREKVDSTEIDLLGIIQNDSLDVSMCPVCSYICPDAASLKSHVKVHGMAFIKSIRKNLNTSTTRDAA